MTKQKILISLSISLLASAGVSIERAVYASTSDSFPWSNMPVESSGDGAYVMEDSSGSLRDSSMAPDQIPANGFSTGGRGSSASGYGGSGFGNPTGGGPGVSLRQSGQMPFTPSQNAINAPGLTPQAGSYMRTDQGFIPTAVDNVAQPLNSLPGNVPIRGGEVVPGSTISGAGVSVGNVDSTQSGPGAAGLFTPNGPGNAAALAAQMSGGLEGSPIVDGAGTNLDIAVPVPTPSDAPDYEHFTIDGTTGLMRDTVYSTGPVAGERVAPAMNDRFSIDNSADFTPQVADEDSDSANSPNASATLADLRGQLKPTTRIAGNVSNTAQLGQANGLKMSARAPRQTRTLDPTKQIGAVTGAIDWGDGDVVLFGTQGELEEEKGNVGTLVLNSGATKAVHGQKQRVDSIEEHM